MISYVNKPWKSNNNRRRLYNNIFASLLLLVLFISTASLLMLSPSAKADSISECKTFSVIGDDYVNGMKENGLEKTLKDKGVTQIKYFPSNDINNIKTNVEENCVIIDIQDTQKINNIIDNIKSVTNTVYVVDTTELNDIHTSDAIRILKINNNSSINQKNKDNFKLRSEKIIQAIINNNTVNATPVADNSSGESSDKTPKDSLTVDYFSGDANKVSPAAFAQKAKNTTSMMEALRYLTTNRWESIPVPTSQVMEIDNVSSLLSPLESTFTQTLLTMSTFTGKALGVLTTIAFSNTILNVFVNGADRIAASFAGLPLLGNQETSGGLINLSNPGAGNTLVIISSLVTIALFTTGYRAFNMKTTKTLQTRLTEWGASMLKFIFALVLAMFIAIQSKNNHMNGDSEIDFTEVIQTQQDISGVSDNNVDINKKVTGDTQKSVTNPETWHSGSMGWLISIIYWFANMFMSVVTNLSVSLIKSPIDYVKSGLNNASKNGTVTASSCDRFVDSMHYVFSETKAAQGNSSASLVLQSIDSLYYELFFDGYAQIYGGDTGSANNSWCWALDVANLDIQPGEWAMIARNAGLYKEALGTGNLMDNSEKVTNGNHMYPPVATLTNTGVGNQDGLLINSSGGWTTEEENGGQVIRLSRYMGRESSTGANQAKYYYAACEWPINTAFGRLSYEWQGVRGMGLSGGASDTSEQQDRETMDLEGNVRGTVLNKLKTWGGNDQWNAKGKINYMLDDVDCQSPTIVPIGYGDEGEEKFGFGTSSQIAKRWEYTPIKDSLISKSYDNVRDSVVASGGISGAIFKGAEKVAESVGANDTQDETDSKNPEKKFGSNIKDDGRRPAYEFWKRTNGNAGGDNIRIAELVGLCLILLFVFVSILLIPAFMINVVLSVLFLLVPAIMVFSFLMYIVRGTKGKG